MLLNIQYMRKMMSLIVRKTINFLIKILNDIAYIKKETLKQRKKKRKRERERKK